MSTGYNARSDSPNRKSTQKEIIITQRDSGRIPKEFKISFKPYLLKKKSAYKQYTCRVCGTGFMGKIADKRVVCNRACFKVYRKSVA